MLSTQRAFTGQSALKKVWVQRSYGAAMRLQSLSLPNMRSMRFRFL